MPKLEVFQSLWAMERRRPDGLEWSLEEKFSMIAEAGYDGVCIDLGGNDVPTAEAAKPLFRKYHLGCSINAFPTCPDELDTVTRMGAELQCRLVSISGRLMPFSVEEGADFARQCLARFKGTGIPAYFETHRFTITNDLLYTIQLLDQVPEMGLVGDISHYVVSRSYPWPVDKFHLDLTDRILRRCFALQGRVSTRNQVQVPISFPQNKPWVEQFFVWWKQAMRNWLERSPLDATFNFLCELGPPSYAITGADGYELSDRWAEAIEIKNRIRELWGSITNE